MEVIMKKIKFLTVMTLSAFILSGCFGSNEDLKEGISNYEKGDEESLSKARLFFNDYLEKNPGNGDAEKYIKKIDEEYIVVGKKAVEKHYENGEIIKAYEIMNNLNAIAPEDPKIKEGMKTIKVLYKEQVELDNFTNYLEDIYVTHFDLFTQWDTIVSEAVLGKRNVNELMLFSREVLSRTIELRKQTQSQTLIIENENFTELNAKLFEHFNSLEQQMVGIVGLPSDATSAAEIRERISYISPDVFNNLYSSLKSDVDRYVNEVDNEDKRVRQIGNSLSFVYEDIKNRQAEELRMKEVLGSEIEKDEK
jgi:hypothetical protein